MSRKHFELIARVLREAPLGPDVLEILVVEFGRALICENPRFDMERFRRAVLPDKERKR